MWWCGHTTNRNREFSRQDVFAIDMQAMQWERVVDSFATVSTGGGGMMNRQLNRRLLLILGKRVAAEHCLDAIIALFDGREETL